MTRDDILRWARACTAPEWMDDPASGWHMGMDVLRFANIVAANAVAAEREACAKACEYRAMALDNSGNQYVRDHAALDCAHSIRARKP